VRACGERHARETDHEERFAQRSLLEQPWRQCCVSLQKDDDDDDGDNNNNSCTNLEHNAYCLPAAAAAAADGDGDDSLVAGHCSSDGCLDYNRYNNIVYSNDDND
jgi:hypothetical protein